MNELHDRVRKVFGCDCITVIDEVVVIVIDISNVDGGCSINVSNALEVVQHRFGVEMRECVEETKESSQDIRQFVDHNGEIDVHEETGEECIEIHKDLVECKRRGIDVDCIILMF